MNVKRCFGVATTAAGLSIAAMGAYEIYDGLSGTDVSPAIERELPGVYRYGKPLSPEAQAERDEGKADQEQREEGFSGVLGGVLVAGAGGAIVWVEYRPDEEIVPEVA